MHVSRVSYTDIAMFHVATTIVRYVFKFVFANGAAIAKRVDSTYALQKYNKEKGC
jgi:hypothetical protein